MNSWDELSQLQKEREYLLDKESEILDEWRHTDNIEEKIKLEEEYKKLPFTDVQNKIVTIINECFNKHS